MKNQGKVAASVVSAVALVGLGATPLTALAAPEAPSDHAAQAAMLSAAETTSTNDTAAVARVEGTFSFNQNEVTSTHEIAGVFTKAAATLCQATPDYFAQEIADKITVCVHGTPALEATMQELSSEDGDKGFVMACACASNAPGGGAAVNAEVQGIPLATIVEMLNA
ncbi:hypothetical protein [Adlercreutzia shanghongiae]|uniref:Uncharacterized protein n=1 Tax=Adlercreutzia shanghongiae TaxID=3111773 RepID=A0ABU6J1X1_9ACTN|nr:hypothetical protein [Adlercreutzia sp. R22]MEC4295895.1 hypothetical protein [Adlercreutzia sp. R22]